MTRNLDFNLKTSPNQLIGVFGDSNISVHLKREDLLHPEVSGNKFRKLKYNLQCAKDLGNKTLLTFGGAFSNHIFAVAAAGEMLGLETIGIIRGEELRNDLQQTLQQNPTLEFAASRGMKLKFVSRENYREKYSQGFIEALEAEFGDFYLLPEGGNNALAIRGCEEILTETDKNFDFICCPVGTGGTLSGIINSSKPFQQVLGFSALKENFLRLEISNLTSGKNWGLQRDYHFGGYAKVTSELIDFINKFQNKYHILLDPVYTGKMLFGISDMIEKSAFPQNSRILAIHTGGLQGIAGINKLLQKKNLPQIVVENEK
jgi:1-aminocyclopropane-1-carboxylate deaminase